MSEHEINRVLLSGRLASDPDLRELPGGTPVCVLRLASQARGRTPGASRSAAREFNVLVLGAKARRIIPYLYRGRRVGSTPPGPSPGRRASDCAACSRRTPTGPGKGILERFDADRFQRRCLGARGSIRITSDDKRPAVPRSTASP